MEEDEASFLEDYGVMTAEGYAFRVEHQQHKGKLLRASRSLAADEELLQEVPLLVWPIAASLLPSSLFSFCENCMQLRPPAHCSNSSRAAGGGRRGKSNSVTSSSHNCSSSSCNTSSSNSSSNSSSTTSGDSCCRPHKTLLSSNPEGGRGDGEEGIVVLLQQGEPPCWFCSSYCRAAALGSRTAGVELTPFLQQQQQLQQQKQVADSGSRCTYTARSWRKRKARSSEALRDAAVGEEEICCGEGATAAAAADADAAGGGNNDPYQMDTESEAAAKSVSYLPQQQQQPSALAEGHLLGGWLSILRPSLLWRLREREQFASPHVRAAAATPTAAAEVYQQQPVYANPLPTEALARAVARIAAQTRALQATVGLPLLHAYSAACRPFVRLAQQQQQQTLGAGQQRLLRDLLLLPLQDAVGAEIAEALLSTECLQQLYAALAVNSQALNVWGAAAATGQLMVLRAGGVYTLHACMNHSCEPNCRVSVGAATRQQQQPGTPGDEGLALAAAREQFPAADILGDQQQEEDESRSNGTTAAIGGGGSLLSIETTRAVQAGEELCISYIDTALPFEQRQQLLWEAYGFRCDCPRCRREACDPQQLLQQKQQQSHVGEQQQQQACVMLQQQTRMEQQEQMHVEEQQQEQACVQQQ